MIKDISNANENVTANSYEIQKLKQALPQCFTSDGSFNMEAFKSILDGNVNITNEGYELKFLGKSYARLLASLDTETIIVPNEEHNNKPENVNSENIYITGDNLDALKHLLKSYEGKIKCIYIDPPYNTGSDGFVYNDKFAFTKDELVRKLSIDEEQAERILGLTNRGSASHSAWLTFMFPRLLLAKDLLANDGVIFISIDDNEYVNLKMLCDNIWGEDKFLANIITVSNPGGRDYDQIAIMHEYIEVYGMQDTVLEELPSEKDFEMFDDNGGYYLRELRNRNPKFNSGNRPNLFYEIFINPDIIDEYGCCAISVVKKEGYTVSTFPRNSVGAESVWRWGKSKIIANILDGHIEGSNVVAKKKRDGGWNIYEKCRKTTSKAKSVWNETAMRTEEGTRLVRSLFGESYFDHPKSIELVARCLNMTGYEEDNIVLDFFSGSATTAHAVMEYNIENNCANKFIMVQLPEPTKANSTARNAGYETIDQIGRERIIRAAAKIREENPDTKADLGFKHYVLQDVPEKKLIELEDFDPDAIFAEEKLLEYFTKPTVLTTWLVKDGYGFNAKVEEIKLADYTAYYCDNHLYFLDTDFDDEAMKALYEKYDAEVSFKPENIVLFGYSFTYTQTALLKDNLKKLKAVEDNKNVNVIVRY